MPTTPLLSTPRLRRLMADWEAVRAAYSGHPHVTVEPLGPLPPERYRLTYRVPGLTLADDVPRPVDRHVCELRLPLGYPREQPLALAVTPLFHPNVAGHYCIADHWSAGEPLTDVIAKVGRLIQWQIFNTKSPLNGVAAHYGEQHPALFPLGDATFGVPDVDVVIAPGDGAAELPLDEAPAS